jgi:quinol monooxygenase YgiN
MIVNTTKVTVLPEKRAEFFQIIGRLLEPIEGSKGCRAFRFYVDAADENSSLLFGEWETESDLNNCLLSDDFAILRGAITVLTVQCSYCRALVMSQTSKP